MGKRKGRAGEQRSADVRGPVAATASEGGEARALLGRKLGRARWGGRGGRDGAGWAG